MHIYTKANSDKTGSVLFAYVHKKDARLIWVK